MKDFLWVEKYAPATVAECILPDHVKKTMIGIVQSGNMQNMVLHSTPGTGKTTVAIAICKEIGAEYIVINGSDEGRLLDTARDRVKGHASSISMHNPDAPKVVIYDEFDNTTKDVQMLLRGCINDFQDNCRFVFTCNSLSRVIDPIQSRCTVIDFANNDTDQKAKLMMGFTKRCMEILQKENIPIEDPKIIAQFIMKMMPDFRKAINELQRYANGHGEINMGLLTAIENSYDALLTAIKNRSYKDARKWLIDNNVGAEFYSEFSVYILNHLEDQLIPPFTILLGDHQSWDAMVYDRVLNASACILKLIQTYSRANQQPRTAQDPI